MKEPGSDLQWIYEAASDGDSTAWFELEQAMAERLSQEVKRSFPSRSMVEIESAISDLFARLRAGTMLVRTKKFTSFRRFAYRYIRRRLASTNSHEPKMASLEAHPEIQPASEDATPDDQAQSDEAWELAEAAIGRLPERKRGFFRGLLRGERLRALAAKFKISIRTAHRWRGEIQELLRRLFQR